ncbi:MAG: hypothetical protein AB7O31_14170 [Burkholderiales bacterium]
MKLRACELPGDALLGRYSGTGGYADCYVAELARQVTQAEYVEAFYTTAVFRLERALLGWFVARPSTDAQARQLAAGSTETFAAWSVEGRSANQLLLRDFQGRTRSWLMSMPAESSGTGTLLYFGSAVVPMARRRTGKATMGLAFRALLGFHRIYSRVLLRAAVSRLRTRRNLK